ncbi:NAD-dependent epimerase/dehydratase family protein [Dactylosporangium sp. NPDC051485]|uniref:NAD-dependent epimerase/dehydratase family protein n=1 Tax=Dactylosporangium sp. NPDC051485 TaxID=3154846 RepID=UPI003429DA00
MSLHVIAGAGGTGSPTALLLADAGERVRLISRRGGGPEHPLIERIAADATDADRLTELTRGAATLINTAMPPYDRWPAEFPALAAALLTTAERTGAGYVMMGNTYGYGRVDGHFTEDLPMAPVAVKGQVRAQMWLDALASHEAGRARVTEVRASAFLGAGAGSLYNWLVPAPVLAGQPAAFPGDLDAPKTWSYLGDVARTLTTVARDDRSWGRAWHVPSTATISVRDLTGRLAELAGVPTPRLTSMSVEDLTEAGRRNPIIAEVVEMMYSLVNPDLLDSAVTEQMFGLVATPLDDVLRETVQAFPPTP